MKNEIILYQSEELLAHIEVRVENETVWLTQTQIVNLFASSKANISEHIKNIYETGELQKESTVRKIRTVQAEGNRKVTRNLTHYNLDMIISIGYRVNSIRGTHFRIWANQILKEYLLRGYSLNQRMNRIEENVHSLEDKVDKIDLQIHTSLPPKQGIIYEGQIFDAHVFVSKIIRSAKQSIIIIDNYIDDSVLTLLTNRKKGVVAKIYTKTISKRLALDIKKFNEQYGQLDCKELKNNHDRFIIIDEKDMYHSGASLKDLGRKISAFSKFDKTSLTVLGKLK